MKLVKTEAGLDINFDCPLCGHNLEVDARGMGMKVPCPECGGRIEVPVPEAEGVRRRAEAVGRSAEEASSLKLSNYSHDGSKKRCLYCKQYMYSDAVICPACGYDQIRRKKHRTKIRREMTIRMPWGVLVSLLLLAGFIYVVFYSSARPEIPRTRKLLKSFCEKIRPAGSQVEGGVHP